MSSESAPKHGPLANIGYWIKRTATYLYGPADLPDDVDPIAQMDDEMGVETQPHDEPHVSERQQAYDNLPRSEHE
jgi:hypothetical protein